MALGGRRGGLAGEMGKRILIVGYFGFDNVGDETILQVECERLRQLRSDLELSVLMDNQARARELALTSYKRKSIYQIYQAIKAADLVLEGGGGLFQDSTGPGSVMYYGSILAAATMLQKPSFLLSHGFGPIRTDLGKLLAKSLLPLASKATFRDAESLEEFKKFAPQVEAQVTADPVFLLKPGDSQKSQDVLSKCCLADASAPVVVISVRSWLGLSIEKQAKAYNDWWESLEVGNRPQFVIVPLQYWYDEGISKRLGSLLKAPSVVAPKLSGEEILALVAAPQVEMTVAMRLHALILTACAGKAMLGVAYDPKVANTCELCGAPYLHLKELDEENFAQKLTDAWEHRNDLALQIRRQVEMLRAKADTAFTMAMEML